MYPLLLLLLLFFIFFLFPPSCAPTSFPPSFHSFGADCTHQWILEGLLYIILRLKKGTRACNNFLHLRVQSLLVFFFFLFFFLRFIGQEYKLREKRRTRWISELYYSSFLVNRLANRRIVRRCVWPFPCDGKNDKETEKERRKYIYIRKKKK